MDMRFPAFDRGTAEAEMLPSFEAMVAMLAVSQSGGRTAQIAAAATRVRPMPTVPVGALVILLGGKEGWATGALALGGSFHPHVAEVLLERGSER